jgi:type II secretory pathway pseudopilin PulG
MKRRRGLSLVEVVVVMTAASVVLGTTATLLYTMMRAERAARHEIQRRAVLGRLADQFRSDAHAATGCVPLVREAGQNEASLWRFNLPGEAAVVYQNDPEGLARTERAGGSEKRRESFALPAESTARIEVPSGTTPAIVSLWIVPAGQSAAQPPGGPVRIDAVLGRDQRYLTRQGP